MSDDAKIKQYRVRMRFLYPAWDEVDGYIYDVVAQSKDEACKRARRAADYDGHTGRRYFKVESIENAA